MYYGQFETDKIIEKYFEEKTNGVCIEVGSADGMKGSNTLFFEQLGWECYCIEPIPEYANISRYIRNNVIECACSDNKRVDNFNIVDLGDSNILSSLSSLDTDKRLYKTHGHLINKISSIEVSVDTLENIINENNITNIDFISIDTEGTELDVLKGINLEENKIPLLVVENNFNDSDHLDFLKQFGYTLDQRYKVNDFYIL